MSYYQQYLHLEINASTASGTLVLIAFKEQPIDQNVLLPLGIARILKSL